ncbi:MAG: hypothetical protein DHS20C09_21120 [marine bacterium B5-7]|nr:MAG: hypothetical protein DHS20C09_21120 [marine bacterium B5-7]
MTDEQNNRLAKGKIIKKLFDQCLDLTEQQQTELIAQSDASEAIKKHVLKLLKYSGDEVELTQAVVDSVQVSLDIKPITIGMKIGAYELVKPLGEGGQGEVWMANRTDGNFNHQVAIKFLKPVHNHTDLVRFQSERELLASLNHPNIAQLLDGGELGENRPYMILELVEGLPVLDYCQQKNFNLKQYLTCFLQICDAVSYAHSHSVIHRDIKPSNIYVTHDGTVKLLDFGIAKFIHKDEIKTQTLPIMTLAYSSPEQVTGGPVSTATDIYTLGLLMYEMLTGQRAQAVISDVPAEMIHEITEQIPTLPSQLVRKIKIKRSYGRRQLQGDLDNLILMALRKEPERRYATVAAMAKDIENYLDGKPLVAVGDSWYYSINKFLSRNPTGTALSALVLAFMVALPLMMFNNQKQLKVERDKALIAQSEAQEQTTIANRTTDFLVNILESASPLGHQGEPINLDDVLASAERQLAVGLDEQPKIKATLLGKLAGIQHQLGNNEQAVKHYQTVLQVFENENNAAGQAFALGQLAVMSFFANNEAEAMAYRDRANQLSQYIEDNKDLAWHQARMATLANYLNEDAYVVELLTQTLRDLEQARIDDPALLGRIYNELSIATDDDEIGLGYISQALEFAETLNGKMHPLYQNRNLNKAMRLKDLERYEEAEAVFLEVRKDTLKLFTHEHPTYSSALAELGALYHDKGRFNEVEEIYLEAIDISKKVSGVKSLNYVLQINNLAYLYEDMGRFEQAELLYRESVQLRQTHFSGNPIRVASSQSNLARLLAKRGQFAESQAIIDEIIPVFNVNKRSNRQNEITAIANLIKNEPSQELCQTAIQAINSIIPEVEKLSSQSWRRMQSELWLGEMALKCQDLALAKSLITAAKDKAAVIYVAGSDGQKIIQSKTDQLLNKISAQAVQ